MFISTFVTFNIKTNYVKFSNFSDREFPQRSVNALNELTIIT